MIDKDTKNVDRLGFIEFGQTAEVLGKCWRIFLQIESAAHLVGQFQQSAIGDSSHDIVPNLGMWMPKQGTEQVRWRVCLLAQEQVQGIEDLVRTSAQQALAEDLQHIALFQWYGNPFKATVLQGLWQGGPVPLVGTFADEAPRHQHRQCEQGYPAGIAESQGVQ
mgnify:CR=1 FL=1